GTKRAGGSAARYVNRGQGDFEDRRGPAGLGPPTFGFTGFGTDWIDYDNDGNLDLFVTNGAVKIVETLRGQSSPYRQRNQLFHNQGDGRFTEITADAEPVLGMAAVGRGAAFGDIDNDGNEDVLVTSNNGPARLLLNEAAGGRHWLTVRLEGVQDNRMGLGAAGRLVGKGRR